MNEQSDQSLVEKTCQGDRAAYEILIQRYYRRVYAVCLSVLGNAHTAQDICQETMLRGLLKIKDLRKSEQFASWIIRVAKNLCIDHIRKNKRFQNVRNQLMDKKPNPDGQFSDLTDAISRLPSEQRTPLLMFYFDGKNSRSIGEVLGLSHATVCRRIRQAKQTLYEILNESEYKNESQAM